MAQQAETTTPPNGTSNAKQKSTHMTQRAENPITPVEPVHARTGAKKTNTPETVVARPGATPAEVIARQKADAERSTRAPAPANGGTAMVPAAPAPTADERARLIAQNIAKLGGRGAAASVTFHGVDGNFPRSDGADLPIGTLAVFGIPNFRAGFCNFRNGGYEEEMRGIDEVQVEREDLAGGYDTEPGLSGEPRLVWQQQTTVPVILTEGGHEMLTLVCRNAVSRIALDGLVSTCTYRLRALRRRRRRAGSLRSHQIDGDGAELGTAPGRRDAQRGRQQGRRQEAVFVMTPLYTFLLRQALARPQDRTDGWRYPGNAETLRADLRDIHCFEVTAAMPLIAQLGATLTAYDDEKRDGLCAAHGFLPAPKTWIECRLSPEDRQPERFALLVEPAPQKEAVVSATFFRRTRASYICLASFAPMMLHLPGRRDLERYVGGAPATEEERRLFLPLVALFLLNSPQIVGRQCHEAHKGLAREVRQHRNFGQAFRLLPWHEIKLQITKPADIDDGKAHQDQITGRRALHFVRKFMRIRLGRLEYVHSHWRGDPALGIHQSDYRVGV
jgi:hypothetical protein